MFGFRNDGIPHQLIHLFDEGQSIGQDGKLSHGPNAVISMIDHGLGTIGRGEEICSMHADNCAGYTLCSIMKLILHNILKLNGQS